MTMTVSTGMLKFQPLVEAVIVIVTSHRPEVKRYCSLILNSYLDEKEIDRLCHSLWNLLTVNFYIFVILI